MARYHQGKRETKSSYSYSRTSSGKVSTKMESSAQGRNLKSESFANKEISKLKINELFDYECLYFRNLELATLPVAVLFPNLKILDISFNELTDLSFLTCMPALRHLCLTHTGLKYFTDIPALPHLENLIVSDNELHHFKGVENFPNLIGLKASKNNISTFQFYPDFPHLQSLDLVDNPVCLMKHFRLVSIALHRQCFRKINGKDIDLEERRHSKKFLGKIVSCVRDGFFRDRDDERDFEAECMEFFKEKQSRKTKDTNLELIGFSFSECVEGDKSKIDCIFKVIDPYKVFEVKGLAKRTLKVSSTEEKVFVFLNHFDPVLLENNGKGEHSITILIPVGEYDAVFKTEDGKNISSEDIILEKGDDEDETDIAEEKTTLFFVSQWYKANDEGIFQSIPNANGISYLPKYEDIGSLIMAEIICFDGDDKIFSICDVSDSPVKPGFPKCTEISLVGEFSEFKTIKCDVSYLGGDEGKSIYKWWNEEIETEGKEYEIRTEDIGKRVRFDYTPVRSDGVQGKTLTIYTERILPSPPIILKMSVKGSLEEGNPLEVEYIYAGGKEGETKIQWFRKESSGFEKIEGATGKSYITRKEDTKKILKVVVIPVGEAKEEGKPYDYTLQYPIQSAPPVVKSLQICGPSLTEGVVLSLKHEYFGGREGKSKIEWFRVLENNQRIGIQSQKRFYVPTLQDVNHQIEVQYVPFRSDKTKGAAVYAITDGFVNPGDPRCHAMKIIGELTEGKTIGVETQYSGGLEGQSSIEWFRGEEEMDMEQVVEFNGKRSYHLSLADVGKIIKVLYSPIRSDGKRGSPLSCTSEKMIASAPPQIANVKMSSNSPVEGDEIVGSADFYGGYEKNRIHRWYRIDESENTQLIEGAGSDTYVATFEDVFCKIIYSVQVEREDTSTEWVKVDPSTVKAVKPLLPVVSEIKVSGECVEGETLRVEATGNSLLNPQNSKCTWKRNIGNEEIEISKGLEYIISLEDVGKNLIIEYIPVRASSIEIIGKPVYHSTDKILPSKPTVLSCNLSGEFVEGEKVICKATYTGGTEGSSCIKWFRVKENGENPIDDSDNRNFVTLSEKEVGSKLKVIYTPMRSDGELGEPFSFVSDSIVMATEPRVSKMNISGEFSEDSELLATYEYKGGCEGQSHKIWYRIEEDGKKEVVAVDSTSYIIKPSDVGKCVVFECLPVRSDGVKGKISQVSSPKIEPQGPSVKNVKTVGEPFVSKQLSVNYLYKGGVEGDSEVSWYSSTSKEGPFGLIPGANGKSYTLNADDFHQYIKVRYLPVRKDGKKGNPVETIPIIPISIAPEMQSRIRDDVIKTISCYDITSETGDELKLSMKHKKFKVKNSKKSNLMKMQFDNSVQISIDSQNAKKFSIQHKKGSSSFLATSAEERNLLVLTFRTFQALCEKALIEQIYGKKLSDAWKNKKNIQQALMEVDADSEVPRDPPKNIDAKMLPLSTAVHSLKTSHNVQSLLSTLKIGGSQKKVDQKQAPSGLVTNPERIME